MRTESKQTPARAYIRRARRRAARKRLGCQRSFLLELHDDGRITWECGQCGHVYTRQRGDWPMGEKMVRQLAKRYWRREGGGCASLCPKCEREAYRRIDAELAWIT